MSERLALITGASAGLGAEFARQLAAAGTNLVLVARRADKLQGLATALADEYGVITHICPADLGDTSAPGSIQGFCEDRGFGRVVNVASVAARIPRSGGSNYGPSKAYLVALSEELNLTVAASGVHVSALCPGFTHTDFHETAGLMDMKNGMPKWLWYDANVVVGDAIKGVEAAKPVVISGRLYRWLDPLFQSVWTRKLFRIKARPD